MEVHTLIIYFIASIILFFILNEVLKRSNKIIHFVMISCCYILLLSGICSSFHVTKNNDSIFIIILFELFIRICYVNLIRESNFFFDRDLVKKYFVSFFTVFGLNTFFISKVSNVFLDLEQLKIIIWLLFILYVVWLERNGVIHKDNVLVKKEMDNFNVKQEYVIMQYAKLKNKYSSIVHPAHKNLIPIVYAIMIYENKNRPEAFRKLDYYLYKLNGKGRKFGIMGIYSHYYIDDENSISIAIRRLNKIYYKVSKQRNNICKLVLDGYYGKENVVREVIGIVNEIRKFDQK